MNPQVIAIIPARGGSKGVPGKNLRRIGGRSLIERAVDACRAARLVDAVYVSTDDAEIATTAEASRSTPKEVISSHSREDRVSKIMIDQLDTSVKIIRRNKWACALHEDHDLWLLANHEQLVESME
jgi:CMP-N-acetylneuraminic acid synthetase